MKFTVKEVVDAARTILLDTDSSNYRFTNSEVCLAVRDGIKKLRGVRPESRYYTGMLVDSLLEDSSGADQEFSWDGTEPSSAFMGYYVKVEDRWQEALVYYVVFRMYQKDDPDTANAQLSQNYFNMFVEGAKS